MSAAEPSRRSHAFSSDDVGCFLQRTETKSVLRHKRMSMRAGIGVALMTKLDEISRVIGNIEAEVRGLSASVAEVRQSSAEHHRETRERLESINGRVAKIEADMKPLAKTV